MRSKISGHSTPDFKIGRKASSQTNPDIHSGKNPERRKTSLYNSSTQSSSDSFFKMPKQDKQKKKQVSFEEGDPLFIAFPSKTKMAGYLEVGEGEPVTVLFTKTPTPGLFIAKNVQGEIKKILAHALNLTIHSENLYLELMDILATTPSFLGAVLNLEHPNIVTDLMNLLSARNKLGQAIEKLCESEYQMMIKSKTEDDILRTRSPAIILISALIESSDDLTTYRNNFIEFVANSIAAVKKRKKELDAKMLPVVLIKCFDYFEAQSIPSELFLILSSLKKASSEKVFKDYNQSTKLLGSIFFLRFICAEMSRKTGDLKTVSRALMKIANQDDQLEPNKESRDEGAKILYQCNINMRELHTRSVNFLNGIACLNTSLKPPTTLLISTARSIYHLVMSKFSNNPDEELCSALEKLRIKLGGKDDDEKIIQGIEAISQFIDKTTVRPKAHSEEHKLFSL